MWRKSSGRIPRPTHEQWFAGGMRRAIQVVKTEEPVQNRPNESYPRACEQARATYRGVKISTHEIKTGSCFVYAGGRCCFERGAQASVDSNGGRTVCDCARL